VVFIVGFCDLRRTLGFIYRRSWRMVHPPVHPVYPNRSSARPRRATRAGRRSRRDVSAVSARSGARPLSLRSQSFQAGLRAYPPVGRWSRRPSMVPSRRTIERLRLRYHVFDRGRFVPDSHSNSKWFGVMMSAIGHRRSRNISGISAFTNRPEWRRRTPDRNSRSASGCFSWPRHEFGHDSGDLRRAEIAR
jgi:hypothetical protein